MTDFWETVLNFAETTAFKVGKQLMEDFESSTFGVELTNIKSAAFREGSIVEKADGSLVTKSDKWADREIREAIAAAFPTHGILTEESEHTFPNSEWCWIIDPVDGTTNFARGIPIWGISLALLYKGTPVFGYVHLPPLGQSFHGFWYGETGITGPTGAFLNQRAISSSKDSPNSNHFFSFCSRSISLLQQPFPCKIRMLGVASYNFLTVAAGFTVGGVEATPKIWDIAGVWAIVQAAGAVWVSLKPEPIFPLTVGEDYGDRSFPTLVVAQPEIVPMFQPLVAALK